MAPPGRTDTPVHQSSDACESLNRSNWQQPSIAEDVSSKGNKDARSGRDLHIEMPQYESTLNEKHNNQRHTVSPQPVVWCSSKLPVSNPSIPGEALVKYQGALRHSLFNQAPPPVTERRIRPFAGISGAGMTFDGLNFSDTPEIIGVSQPPARRDSTRRLQGILKPPTESFPEDPSPIREGVAPLKDGKKRGIPRDARWTKISRKLVNPEALELGKERFEAMKDFVVVLRPLSREEVKQYSEVTEKIRGMCDQISLYSSANKILTNNSPKRSG